MFGLIGAGVVDAPVDRSYRAFLLFLTSAFNWNLVLRVGLVDILDSSEVFKISN